MTRIKPRTLLAVQALAGALACGAAFAQDGPQRLASTQLTAGFHLINAEVASTQEQRAIGLMNRPAMPANDGMLFVFERPGEQCFWMKNTLLPLSIAFLDEDGTIVNIADMKPQTLDSHCSAKPVRFALEMNQGWFAKRALKAGTRLKGAPFGGR
ncbi:DUF192 domain-containing protein [Piscinibacter sp.]|uniref:DUF192 domain-containing protein n=1 Tax=Piscinibacter sp. TaxID=1903157 RepID=UPI0035AE1D4E